MRIHKPANVGVLPVAVPECRGWRLSVGVLLGFGLDGDNFGPLLPEQVWWPAATARLDGQALDEGWPKPRGEYLVLGSCVLGVPARQASVGVRVGNMDKTLAVLGDYGASPLLADPVPFKRIPLTWDRTFGGPGFAGNPLGRGFASQSTGPGKMPNILPMNGKPGIPVGFAPMGPEFPARRPGGAAFGREWLASCWPSLPEGLDPQWRNTAPLDQRLPGFFAGDEKLELRHMHPDKPVLTGRLPGRRARLFALPGQGGDLREIPLKAETLWLLPEEEMGILLFRGVVEVEDERCRTVAWLLADTEPMAAEPLPVEHYQAMLPVQAPAPPSPAEFAPGIAPGFSAPSPEGTAAQAGRANATGALPDAAAATPRKAVETVLNTMGENIRQALIEYGVPEGELPGLSPSADAPGMSLAEAAAMLLEQGVFTQAQHDELLAAHRELENALAGSPGGKAGGRAGTVRVWTRRTVLEAVAAGRSLSGENLQELDLSGCDLDGADFSGCLLEKTDFSGTSLRGAGLSGAMAPGAVFREAALAGADLSRAILPGADFGRAVLDQAVLASADLSKANLRECAAAGADLTGAVLQSAVLAAAAAPDLTAPGADFSGADCSGAILTGAVLNRADFSGAVLDGADLRRVKARGISFMKATGTGTLLGEADLANARACVGTRLDGADFSGADLGGACLTGADLSRSILRGALLDGANLGECALGKADLRSASAVEINLTRADLTGADLSGSNLFHAVLRHALLGEAKIRNANAFGADLYKANVYGLDTQGANLGRTLLSLAVLS